MFNGHENQWDILENIVPGTKERCDNNGEERRNHLKSDKSNLDKAKKAIREESNMNKGEKRVKLVALNPCRFVCFCRIIFEHKKLSKFRKQA